MSNNAEIREDIHNPEPVVIELDKTTEEEQETMYMTEEPREVKIVHREKDVQSIEREERPLIDPEQYHRIENEIMLFVISTLLNKKEISQSIYDNAMKIILEQ